MSIEASPQVKSTRKRTNKAAEPTGLDLMGLAYRNWLRTNGVAG